MRTRQPTNGAVSLSLPDRAALRASLRDGTPRAFTWTIPVVPRAIFANFAGQEPPSEDIREHLEKVKDRKNASSQ